VPLGPPSHEMLASKARDSNRSPGNKRRLRCKYLLRICPDKNALCVRRRGACLRLSLIRAAPAPSF
jgi:hypothetical protein